MDIILNWVYLRRMRGFALIIMNIGVYWKIIHTIIQVAQISYRQTFIHGHH